MKYSIELEEKYRRYLLKALTYLEKSFSKAQKLPTRLDKCTDEDLETWESFTSRFARVVDIFLTKYICLMILKQDPGFEGTIKDYLNFAEKIGIREYRNIQAHDYTEESFDSFVTGLLHNTPELLKIRQKFHENI